MNDLIQNQRLKAILKSYKSWLPSVVPSTNLHAPTVIKKMSGGLTNDSFLITVEHKKFILRLNNENSHAFRIDRYFEKSILDTLSHMEELTDVKLAPKLLFSSFESDIETLNFSVFEYIVGKTWQSDYFYKQENINRLRKAIRHYQEIDLHFLTDTKRFDYLEHITYYWNALKAQKPNTCDRLYSDYKSFVSRLKDFQNRPWPSVLVHHDLVPGNIMECDSGLIILDWEYAGFGHPAFDHIYIDTAVNKNSESTIYDASSYSSTATAKSSKSQIEDQGMLKELIYWINTLWFCINDI